MTTNTYAVVDGTGLIVNRILLDDKDAWSPEEGHSVVKEADTNYAIGGKIVSGSYTPPPVPEVPPTPVVVPPSISDRQFFQQLAVAGIISQDEALASNAAVIPAPLLSIINAMPADQQFAAKMLVSGATVFERSNPMTIAIGTAYGWNAGQIDDFFQAAAKL